MTTDPAAVAHDYSNPSCPQNAPMPASYAVCTCVQDRTRPPTTVEAFADLRVQIKRVVQVVRIVAGSFVLPPFARTLLVKAMQDRAAELEQRKRVTTVTGLRNGVPWSGRFDPGTMDPGDRRQP